MNRLPHFLIALASIATAVAQPVTKPALFLDGSNIPAAQKPTFRTNVGLAIGTDVQAQSAKLSALAAQTWAADKLTYQTGTSAVATTTITSAARGLLDDADAAAMRTTLGPTTAADYLVASRVVCWGDSLTAGSGGQISWPAQFAPIAGYGTINRGVGGENSEEILERFEDEPERFVNNCVIWEGHNDYGDWGLSAPTHIKASIAAKVAALGHNRYIVIGLVNDANEPEGSDVYNSKLALNAELAALYPGHYLDIQPYLVSQYNPSLSGDVTDHANDIPPRSLRVDDIHFTSAGYGLIAAQVATMASTVFTSAADSKFVTLATLRAAMANPGGVGTAATPAQNVNAGILSFGNNLLFYPSGNGEGVVVPALYPQTSGQWFGDDLHYIGRFFVQQLDFPGPVRAYASGDGTGFQLNSNIYPASDGVGSKGRSDIFWATDFTNTYFGGDFRFKANTDVRIESVASSPEGSLSRDYGSIALDRTTGVLWTKRTDVTRSTGWESNATAGQRAALAMASGIAWNGSATGSLSPAVASVGTGDFTACALIRPTSFAGYPRILGTSASGSGDTMLAFNGSGFPVCFDGATVAQAAYPAPTAEWSVLITTRSSGVVSIYLNKVYVGGGTMAGSMSTQDKIGGDSPYFYNGALARVFVMDQASSAEEVAAIVDAGCLPDPAAAAHVIYAMDDGDRYTQAAAEATGLADLSGNGCTFTLPGSGAARLIRPRAP